METASASDINTADDITDFNELWDMAQAGNPGPQARIELYAEMDRVWRVIRENLDQRSPLAQQFTQTLHRDDQEMYVAPMSDLQLLREAFYQSLPINQQRYLMNEWKSRPSHPSHAQIVNASCGAQRARGLLVRPDFPPKSNSVHTSFDYWFTHDTTRVCVLIAEGARKEDSLRDIENALTHLRMHWHDAISRSPESFDEECCR